MKEAHPKRRRIRGAGIYYGPGRIETGFRILILQGEMIFLLGEVDRQKLSVMRCYERLQGGLDGFY